MSQLLRDVLEESRPPRRANRSKRKRAALSESVTTNGQGPAASAATVTRPTACVVIPSSDPVPASNAAKFVTLGRVHPSISHPTERATCYCEQITVSAYIRMCLPLVRPVRVWGSVLFGSRTHAADITDLVDARPGVVVTWSNCGHVYVRGECPACALHTLASAYDMFRRSGAEVKLSRGDTSFVRWDVASVRVHTDLPWMVHPCESSWLCPDALSELVRITGVPSVPRRCVYVRRLERLSADVRMEMSVAPRDGGLPPQWMVHTADGTRTNAVSMTFGGACNCTVVRLGPGMLDTFNAFMLCDADALVEACVSAAGNLISALNCSEDGVRCRFTSSVREHWMTQRSSGHGASVRHTFVPHANPVRMRVRTMPRVRVHAPRPMLVHAGLVSRIRSHISAWFRPQPDAARLTRTTRYRCTGDAVLRCAHAVMMMSVDAWHGVTDSSLGASYNAAVHLGRTWHWDTALRKDELRTTPMMLRLHPARSDLLQNVTNWMAALIRTVRVMFQGELTYDERDGSLADQLLSPQVLHTISGMFPVYVLQNVAKHHTGAVWPRGCSFQLEDLCDQHCGDTVGDEDDATDCVRGDCIGFIPGPVARTVVSHLPVNRARARATRAARMYSDHHRLERFREAVRVCMNRSELDVADAAGHACCPTPQSDSDEWAFCRASLQPVRTGEDTDADTDADADVTITRRCHLRPCEDVHLSWLVLNLLRKYGARAFVESDNAVVIPPAIAHLADAWYTCAGRTPILRAIIAVDRELRDDGGLLLLLTEDERLASRAILHALGHMCVMIDCGVMSAAHIPAYLPAPS